MFRQVHLEQCDSTQDELERHVEGDNQSESVLISTSKQLNGRGRGAHSWEYNAGSLAFSFTVSPHPELTWQSLEVAICLAQFFEKRFSTNLQLKWPNDIYSNEKKCGGILLKKTSTTMLVGIGINLLPNSNWGSVFNESIQLESDWSSKIPAEFVRYYLQVHPVEVASIRSEWNKRCVHLNKLVHIQDGETRTHGTFVGLGEHGQALIQTDSRLESIYNGTLRW